MSSRVTPPEPHALIPPLLAILPISFASSRPPPALLPLLSPILQQRINIHTSTPGSEHDSWLRLLCWDAARAEILKEHIENADFEPHPSSGEIEMGDVGTIKYKKFDAETLRAQIPLPDWELTAVFVWCAGAESGSAWQLAELLPFDNELLQDPTWFLSTKEAADAVGPPAATLKPTVQDRKLSVPGGDDDYWAMYDQSPGQTPARQGSINPGGVGVSDDDYYARYGNVQPALDAHDPEEAEQSVGETTLHGDALQQMLVQPRNTSRQPAQATTLSRFTSERSMDDEDVVHVNHPVPSSPSSRAGSDTVAKLEKSAERYTASEIAIRQHISTTMKSMYRLAKASGIERDEFDRMVQRELDTLSMLDAND